MKIIPLIFCFVLIQFLGNAYAEIEGKDIKINKILSLKIQSAITPATFGYLKEGFKEAQSKNYDLVQVTLNTPGGMVSTTKKILTLFGESNIPVAVWIRPEGASATSAGAIIASAAHILMMSDGTNIGAATPIEMSGDIKSKDLRSKAINDLVALVSSLAKTRGRNAKLFSEMISKASSFESHKAKKKNLIDEIANTQYEFISKLENLEVKLKGSRYSIHTQNPEVTEFKMDLGLSLLEVFANPATAYILFVIGAALLYLELQTPGGFIAGSIGAVCLLLAGIGFQVLPLNMGALGLIILSFILFIMEVYITSYGILSIGALVALISGSLFLYRTDDAYLELSRTLIFSTSAAIALFLGFITYYMIQDQKNIGNSKFNEFVGSRGEVLSFLENDNDIYYYQAKINGEIWKVRSKNELMIGEHYTIIDQNLDKMILTI
ncbi:MAG: nodulation protein NfeD [Bacteriovoracaceae bacterium]|jgi:membrane-bound serine protease (ClpP class)|nr:nodulation protein NfeD [Bacteriovoracaceae bacterium]